MLKYFMIIEYAEELNKLYCYFKQHESTIKCYKMIVPSTKRIEEFENTLVLSGRPYLLPTLEYKEIEEEKIIEIKCIHNNNYNIKRVRKLPRNEFIELIDSYTCCIPLKVNIDKELQEETLYVSDFYVKINKNSLPKCCKDEKIYLNECINRINYKRNIFKFLENYFILKDFIVIKKDKNYEIKYFHKTFLCDANLKMTHAIRIGIKETDMIVRINESVNDYFQELIYAYVKENSIGVKIDEYVVSILCDVAFFDY